MTDSRHGSASDLVLSENRPYVIVFDGGSLGNPGKGYGSYVLINPMGRELREQLEFPPDWGPLTNNQAEYHTLIRAFEHLAEQLGERKARERVRVEGDSQLVLYQISGKWKVKNAGLRPLRDRAQQLMDDFASVEVAWHPRARSVRILGH
jgi:ribonuclease HI